MSHLKRQQMPKSWPIPRKGTKFVVKPASNVKTGVPLLIFVRDMLKLAQNRKEVKKAINLKHILINGRIVKDERQVLLLLDVVSIIPSKKNYKLILTEKGKFTYEEVSNSGFKCVKIIDKKILKRKKTQINLMDGRNYLSEIKCKINDSVVVDFKTNKISKYLDLKEGSKVLVFAGKHAGTIGIIKKIEEKMIELSVGEKKINVLIKQLMVIE